MTTTLQNRWQRCQPYVYESLVSQSPTIQSFPSNIQEKSHSCARKNKLPNSEKVQELAPLEYHVTSTEQTQAATGIKTTLEMLHLISMSPQDRRQHIPCLLRRNLKIVGDGQHKHSPSRFISMIFSFGAGASHTTHWLAGLTSVSVHVLQTT